jgi:hypothetical protein
MAPDDPPPADEPTKLGVDAEERYQKARKELEAEWDRKLACLHHPDAHARIDAIFEAQGRTKTRPKAGTTF